MTELYRVVITPQPPQRDGRRWRRYGLLAGLAVVVLAVGSATAGILVARDDAKPQANPTQSTSPAASVSPASSAGPADPGGTEACRLVTLASDNDELLIPAKVAAILLAAKSSRTFEVQFDAQMLSNKQELALADSRDHATYVFDLQSAAYKMQEDCINAGLAG